MLCLTFLVCLVLDDSDIMIGIYSHGFLDWCDIFMKFCPIIAEPQQPTNT